MTTLQQQIQDEILAILEVRASFKQEDLFIKYPVAEFNISDTQHAIVLTTVNFNGDTCHDTGFKPYDMPKQYLHDKRYFYPRTDSDACKEFFENMCTFYQIYLEEKSFRLGAYNRVLEKSEDPAYNIFKYDAINDRSFFCYSDSAVYKVTDSPFFQDCKNFIKPCKEESSLENIINDALDDIFNTSIKKAGYLLEGFVRSSDFVTLKEKLHAKFYEEPEPEDEEPQDEEIPPAFDKELREAMHNVDEFEVMSGIYDNYDQYLGKDEL